MQADKDLIDEIEGLAGKRRPNQCATCWELRDASDDLKKGLDRALAGGAGPTATAAALRRRGYDVSSDSIRRHQSKGHKLT